MQLNGDALSGFFKNNYQFSSHSRLIICSLSIRHACHEILFVVVNETDETPLQDSTFDFVIFIYLLLMLLLAILQTAQVQICKQTNAAAVHGKLSERRTDGI